jgi:hypothetical protein
LSPVFGVSTLIKLSDAFNDENANDVKPWISLIDLVAPSVNIL